MQHAKGFHVKTELVYFKINLFFHKLGLILLYRRVATTDQFID